MTTTLKQYFETASGTGVLSTADAGGKVDAAVYSTPHVMDDGTVAFIMRERLTHENLRSNPYAVYLFMEDAPGHKGIRIFLKKTREDDNAELIASMTRRHLSPELDAQKGPKHLVYFSIERVLPLIGSGAAPVTL
ncbi:MAG: pyridoxamine 5'-phosphate oxidase family protein [Nitrospirae bacterium]|nr:pyridoxamine 5'-phosphate oxidase family protein [Nitrospirota bacterium]NTW65025.1 pyridoxamine 5'-phosphate oxidase family protein [Nitrospirota bacterium]